MMAIVAVIAELVSNANYYVQFKINVVSQNFNRKSES